MLIYSYQFVRILPGTIRDTGVFFISSSHHRFYSYQRSTVNHYDVLGLKSDATNQEIKTAFYQLSKKYHPDVNPNDADAAQKFSTISNAYDILGDPIKRREYDRNVLHQINDRDQSITYNRTSSYAQRARAHRASASRYAYTSESRKTDYDGFSNNRTTSHGNYDQSQYDEQFGRFRGAPPEGYWNKTDFEEFYRAHYSDYASWQRTKKKQKQAEQQSNENLSVRKFSRWTWEQVSMYIVWLSLGVLGFCSTNLLHRMHFQQPTDEFPSRFFKISTSSKNRFYEYLPDES